MADMGYRRITVMGGEIMVVLYHERAAYYQKQRSQDSRVLVEQHERLKRHTQESIVALVVAVGSYCWYTTMIAVSCGCRSFLESYHT